MSEGMPATPPAMAGDGGTGPLTSGGPDDVATVLAQLRETIGNLDALLASVHDVPDPVVTE